MSEVWLVIWDVGASRAPRCVVIDSRGGGGVWPPRYGSSHHVSEGLFPLYLYSHLGAKLVPASGIAT